MLQWPTVLKSNNGNASALNKLTNYGALAFLQNRRFQLYARFIYRLYNGNTNLT